MASSLTEQECPYTGPYALPDNPNHFKSKGPTCEALKRGLSRAGAPSLPWGAFDQHYNQNLEKALDWMDGRWELTGNNGYAEGRWSRIRQLKANPEGSHAGEWALDGYALRLIREEHDAANPAIPNLGAVFAGGQSVLDHDLTHATSGVPLFPAFDDAFGEGITVIAPEPIEVYQASSSNPGDAFYGRGDSKLRYWFGHLVTAPAVGTRIAKGAKIGVTCHNEIGGGPHVHVGVNVENLWGAGKQFEHHTNYTHGAPIIREQLKNGPS